MVTARSILNIVVDKIARALTDPTGVHTSLVSLDPLNGRLEPTGAGVVAHALVSPCCDTLEGARSVLARASGLLESGVIVTHVNLVAVGLKCTHQVRTCRIRGRLTTCS